MKAVKFSLINVPASVGAYIWNMRYGAASPYSANKSFWTASPNAEQDAALSVSLADDVKFFLITAWPTGAGPPHQYEQKTAFTFEDGASYTFDAANNTLSKDTVAPPAGDWLDSLLSFWAGFANTMATWAANAADWLWPLNIVAPLVVAVSGIIDGIFAATLDFRIFYRALALRVSELLDWDEILDHLSEVLDQVAAVWAWFSEWTDSVWDVISTWWDATYDNVKGWVETKVQGLPEMLAAWGNFFTNTLPTLFDLSYAEEWYKSKLAGIGDLIKSAFTERSDLWQGWTDFRQAVSDIVTVPFDWLEERFTDWFLGVEELWRPPPDEVGWPQPHSTIRSK